MLLENRHHKFRKLNTAWLEGGNPEGDLLLCLHGYPDGPEVWELQVNHFAKQYHLVCPYVRGACNSERGHGLSRYTMESLCLDLLQLIEFVDPTKKKRIVLMGHDLGGAIAWRLATFLIDRLNRLTIINSLSLEQMAHRLRNRPKQWLHSWYIYPILLPYLPELLVSQFPERLAKFAYRLGGLDQKLQPEKSAVSTLAIDTLNQYRAFAKEMPKLYQAKPKKIHCPTLVIWGNKDPFLLPPTLDELEPFASPLTVRILSGSHWIFREKPEQVNRLLDSFFHTEQKYARHI